MKQATERYVVPAEGPQAEAITRAYALLDEKCAHFGRNAIILVHKKDTLRRRTVEQGLGTDVAARLLKGQQVVLPGRGLVTLKSERTFRYSFSSDIILAIYPSQRMLGQIDEANCATAIIVLPWRMEDLREWQRMWNPHVVGQPDGEPQQLLDNAVVEEGLKRLTTMLGPASLEMSSLDDRNLAKQLLWELWRHDELYGPDAIRAWAIRHDWPPRYADQLREYAQDIKDGKRVRLGHRLWRDDIVDQLRRGAADS